MMKRSRRIRGVVLCGIAAAVASLAVSAFAADWTRFRGPNGTGVATDKNIPVEFGEGKNVLWKVAIPGSGNSSPIVSKGRIFLQTATANGEERKLLCLDLKDGRTLWEKSAPGGTAKTHPKNTLASCTAAADGTRIYMPFWDGKDLSLSAFDYDGKHLWTTPLGGFQSQHGAGHSPIIHGGKVILANDQDDFAELVALYADTGKVAWKAPRPPFKASYSTPLLLERNGSGPELLTVSTAGVAGYDPDTGSELWKWTWTSNDKQLRTVGSPIVTEGMVFFGGGNGPGDRHSVGVRIDGKGDVTGTNLAWETRQLFPYVPCLLSKGEHLYFVNDEGIAACTVARTGQVTWKQRVPGGKVTASPLMIDGKVYGITETGGTFVFAADTTFKLLSQGQLDEGVMASPAVSDGRLLVRGKQHLYCFGKGEAK